MGECKCFVENLSLLGCAQEREDAVCVTEWYLTHGNGDYRLHWRKAQPSLRQTLTGPSNQNSSFWSWWINLQTCTHAQSLKPYWWTSQIFTNKLDKKPQEQPWKWLFYKCNQSTTWWKCVCTKHFEHCVRVLSLMRSFPLWYFKTEGIFLPWRSGGSHFPGYSGAVNDG